MRKSTIYVLADPRKVEPENRFRYVGKTATELRKRLNRHMSAARNGGHTHVCHWINRLLKDGEYPIILELEVTDEEHDDDREIHWIAHFRAEGFNMCNHTDGGGGIKNFSHSEETKQKQRDIMMGDKNPMYGKGEDRKGEKNWFYGKNHDAAAKRKMSACNKGKNNPNYGKVTSEETRQKLSEAHKGKIVSDETRRKLSEAGKGRIVSDETRRKLSEARKGRKVSDETRRKMSEARKRWHCCKISP